MDLSSGSRNSPNLKLRPSQTYELVPDKWYNIIADLPEPVPPMLDPEGRPVPAAALERLFAKELVRQEFSSERYIKIPEEVRETLIEVGRPTPLMRAYRLEKKLGTKAKIYFKYEGVLPTGSHKINTAVTQAYFNSVQGIKRLVTETGAGQWGSALALAGTLFNLKVRIYMVKVSYTQKPYRRIMMNIYGAEVVLSPSRETDVGRKVLSEDPDHPGTLGIAIAEAIEDTVKHEDTRYSLGSVLNHVLLHQTVIGIEAKAQLEEMGEYPDYVVGCVGGGSNYAGLAYPFIHDKITRGTETKFIAAESKASPSMTKGVYTYDYGDSAGLTPLIKMHTVGHKYRVSPIHAGGLRYHGLAPTLSILINHGIVEPVAYHQNEVFEAAKLFAECEGIVPAPESAHAVKAVIDIARSADEPVTILFNMSGHGLLDLQGYSEFIEGKLVDYEPEKIDLSYLPKVR